MDKPKIPSAVRTVRRTLRLSAGVLAMAGCMANAQQVAPAQGNGADARQGMIPNMNCTGEVGAPAKIELAIGKSTLLKLPEPAINRSLGNPNVAQAMLVAPDTLYLLGVSVGTTNMIVQGKSKRCNVIDVAVSMDATGLINTLRQLMPEEKDIRVTAAAESLVLSGTVSDAIAMQRAYELALAYVRRPAVMSTAAQQEGLANTATGQQVQASTNIQLQQQRVVNMLTLAAAQQVMLEVKIAEVSKSLIDKLGVRLNGSLSTGMWSYQLLSNFLTGTLGGMVSGSRSSTTGFALDAEKRDGLVKVLAEPNVMAISGQEGSFLAGGKILIPVAQTGGVGGAALVTLQEKDFGVGLRFTPTVLSGGRINLQVAPEVSELSREGAGISGTNNATQIFPLITTRRASTTVQLADGQSFAIGGLIKNNTSTNIRAFPILGEIPILGTLFRSTDFQNDKTELVFVVTPRLVKPLPADYALPTDGYRDPSRAELFLGGKLEGKPQPRSAQQDKGSAGFEMK